VREAIFLDSGIFIAFLNARDQWHEQAAGLFSRTTPRWNTSYMVISEAYSWFLHRFGEESARTLMTFIDNLDGLQLFETSHDHHRKVKRMLDRMRGSKLTYVDASSLCFMEKYKIRKVWSTDHHLGLTGAEVFPR
jgi:predicted nucleic acid-binding protein